MILKIQINWKLFWYSLLKQQTNQNHLTPCAISWKPFEIIWNHLKLIETNPKLAITSSTLTGIPWHPLHNKSLILTLFFCCWVWTWIDSQERKIRKRLQNSSNHHESQIMESFSELRLFTSYLWIRLSI